MLIMLIPVWLHGVCDRWVIAFQTTGVRIPDNEFSSSTFVTGLTKVQVCISKKSKTGRFWHQCIGTSKVFFIQDTLKSPEHGLGINMGKNLNYP